MQNPRASVPDNTWSDTPLDFKFTWTPSGLGNGSGRVSGYVQKVSDGSKVTIPYWDIDPSTWPSYGQQWYNFDSFGIWADSSSGTDSTRTHIEYFDNVKYTVVPEPSAAWLWPLGGGLLLLTRRMLRRK